MAPCAGMAGFGGMAPCAGMAGFGGMAVCAGMAAVCATASSAGTTTLAGMAHCRFGAQGPRCIGRWRGRFKPAPATAAFT